MDKFIECSLMVSKVVRTDSETPNVASTLKGQKTIVHNENGYEYEDVVDIEVKLKCATAKSLKALGVALSGDAKILVLRDRDALLSDFDGKSQELAV